MSNKIYKVSGDHLNALGEAAGVIVAFLENIKADDALLNFSAAQALMNLKKAETTPATLEQAIDENAERRLAELDKRRAADKTPCHCHRIHGDKHAVAVCPKPRKPAKPLPKTMKEIAAATGVEYKKIHKYAYAHGIGTATRDATGHQMRVFTDSEVREILKHFSK